MSYRNLRMADAHLSLDVIVAGVNAEKAPILSDGGEGARRICRAADAEAEEERDLLHLLFFFTALPARCFRERLPLRFFFVLQRKLLPFAAADIFLLGFSAFRLLIGFFRLSSSSSGMEIP